MDCNACNTLCDTSPEFVANGVTEKICTSLQNNTGLNPELDVLHTNCEDFEAMNDCLIGRMDKEMDSFPECGWKKFMHKFIPNVYEYLKALNCSICGLWSKAECAMESIRKLVAALNGSVGGSVVVNHVRDNSGTQGGSMYFWDLTRGEQHTLDIYMDASGDDFGSQVADRDYAVVCSNCMDFRNFDACGVEETFYSSGDTRPIETIRNEKAMHPGMYDGNFFRGFSWHLSTVTIVKKGEHLKLNSYVWRESVTPGGTYRIHQISLTWIPIADAGFDLTDIIQC